MNRQELGHILRQLREETGKSQAVFGTENLGGKSQSYVQKVEVGTVGAGIEEISAWMNACNVELLLGHTKQGLPISPLVALAEQLSTEDQKWLTRLAELAIQARGPIGQMGKDMALATLERAILADGQAMPGPPHETPETSRPQRREEEAKAHLVVPPAERSGRAGAIQKKG